MHGRVVDLSNMGLDDQDTFVIAKSLKSTQLTVEELDLSDNTIGSDGAIFLAGALVVFFLGVVAVLYFWKIKRWF